MDAPDMDVAVQRRAGCTKKALPDAGQDVLIASAMQASCPLGLARGDFTVEIPPAIVQPAPGHPLMPRVGHKRNLPRPGPGHNQSFNLLREMIPS